MDVKIHISNDPLSLSHSCDTSRLNNPKHGLSLPFYIGARRYRHRVERVEDADLVVAPAMLDWFSCKLCKGSWSSHKANLTRSLARINKPVVMVATHWMSIPLARELCDHFPLVRMGVLIERTPCDFHVGFMNDVDAINFDHLVGRASAPRIHWDILRPKPRWHIEFAGQVDRRGGYRDRYRLFHSKTNISSPRMWITTSTVTSSSHVRQCAAAEHFMCFTNDLSRPDVLRIRSESNFSLMLRGDNAASDRLENAFVAGALPVVLDRMMWLPFKFAIPWSKILYNISREAFEKDPIASLIWVNDDEDLRRRQELIRRHKADVMFSHPHSRLVSNIIRAAWMKRPRRSSLKARSS